MNLMKTKVCFIAFKIFFFKFFVLQISVRKLNRFINILTKNI